MTIRARSWLSRAELAALFELEAEARRHLVQVRVDPVQRAELAQQGHGGLLADAADAGDVVARVADQGLVVDQLVGFDAELVPDIGRTVVERLGELLTGQPNGDAIGGQLQQVAVSGQDRHGDVLAGRLLGDRSQHVVGLVALPLEDGNAKGRHQLADAVELGRQVFRHLGARRLVLGVDLVAERPPRVEGDCQILGRVLLQQPQQDRGKPVGAGRRLAGFRRPARGITGPRQGVIGPVGQGVAVDEVEARVGGHHGRRSRAEAILVSNLQSPARDCSLRRRD